MNDRRDNPFRGFGPPPAPDGLREASLRAAHAAFTAAPPPDFWTRLVRSRTARLAWAVSFALLLVLHLEIRDTPGTARRTPAASRLDPEVRAVVALPPIDERTLVPYSGAQS
ncbi:MAG: hypothetical protein ACHQPI_06875 [Thermoanaerobaculia bacterium]